MQAEFLMQEEGRKIIWDDFIKYVREGGLFFNYTNTSHGFIHWDMVAACMGKHPDEMPLEELKCAVLFFRSELLAFCLKSAKGGKDRMSTQMFNLLLKIYMPGGGVSDDQQVTEGISRLEEARRNTQRLLKIAEGDISEETLDPTQAETDKLNLFIKTCRPAI